MGVFSAIIVSPCVSAPLAGTLLQISRSGDVLLGGAALFSLAIGMGLPLIVVGVSEGALLPKAGAWMVAVRKFFGVLLLAVALWIVTPLLPATAERLAWGALLAGSALFLSVRQTLLAGASLWRWLWKRVGVIAVVARVALVVSAFCGNYGAVSATPWKRVSSLAELEQRLGST